MSHSSHDVMSKEFLEYDLEEAIRILSHGMPEFRGVLQDQIGHGRLSLEAANERLRLVRHEIDWLKIYRQSLNECPFYTLDDIRSQLRRSLNRLQPVLQLH